MSVLTNTLCSLQEDPKRVLYFAHMFFLDHLFSTCWTVFFGVVWWVYTPHDGKRVANSEAQRQMMNGASGVEGHNMTEEERTEAALGIWNQEKGFAAAILILGWLTKVCMHLRLMAGYCLSARRSISPSLYTPSRSTCAKARTAPSRRHSRRPTRARTALSRVNQTRTRKTCKILSRSTAHREPFTHHIPPSRAGPIL